MKHKSPVLAKMLSLQKVPEILGELDFEAAPNVITLHFQSTDVVYLKQSDGYCGILFDAENGRKLHFTHNVTLTGEKAGWVSPPISTNFIAKRKVYEEEHISREKYVSTIIQILAAFIQTLLEGDDTEDDLNISEMIKAPNWMCFEKGVMSPEQILEAQLAGVEEFILEFCQVADYVISIDPTNYIKAQPKVNSDWVEVVEGAWDAEAARNARHICLKASAVEIAKNHGLTIVSTK